MTGSQAVVHPVIFYGVARPWANRFRDERFGFYDIKKITFLRKVQKRSAGTMRPKNTTHNQPALKLSFDILRLIEILKPNASRHEAMREKSQH